MLRRVFLLFALALASVGCKPREMGTAEQGSKVEAVRDNDYVMGSYTGKDKKLRVMLCKRTHEYNEVVFNDKNLCQNAFITKEGAEKEFTLLPPDEFRKKLSAKGNSKALMIGAGAATGGVILGILGGFGLGFATGAGLSASEYTFLYMKVGATGGAALAAYTVNALDKKVWGHQQRQAANFWNETFKVNDDFRDIKQVTDVKAMAGVMAEALDLSLNPAATAL